MYSKKLYTSLVLALVFIIIFFVKDRFNVELYQDEFHYLPTATYFSKEPIPSLNLLRSYNELNTPVPFILGGWVVKAFGEEIQYLRLLTFGVSFLLLMTFVWSSPNNTNRFYLCLLGLLAFPNYYLCSIFYYTDIFAMISVLAGIVAYIKRIHWLAALFFVVGISCRQYMLAFPAAIVLFEMWSIFKKEPNFARFIQNIFANKIWILYAVAVLSIVPWVLLWHGPAPAAVMADQHYDSDKLIKYNFGYVIYSSVCIAVYYVIPEILLTRNLRYFAEFPRKHPVLFISQLILVILLISFFPAKQAYNPYFTWPFLGYIDQFFTTLGLSGFVKQAVFGLLMMITLMRFITPRFNLASCLVVINVLLLGKAQLSWDKYSLPLIMVLWYLAMFDKEWSLSQYQSESSSEKVLI